MDAREDRAETTCEDPDAVDEGKGAIATPCFLFLRLILCSTRAVDSSVTRGSGERDFRLCPAEFTGVWGRFSRRRDENVERRNGVRRLLMMLVVVVRSQEGVLGVKVVVERIMRSGGRPQSPTLGPSHAII